MAFTNRRSHARPPFGSIASIGWLPGLALIAALATVTTLVVIPTAPARADTAANPPAILDASHASDPVSAAAIAAQFGHPVMVDSDSSATVLVDALPDGQMQATTSVLPSLVSQSGTWVPENTDLHADNSAAWIVPEAAAVPVKFSEGGSSTLAEIQTSSGSWMTETWPYGALPTPEVDGSSATYADVFPGVDLALTATPAGMSQVLIVKSEQAASNPALSSLDFTMNGATVSPQTKVRSLSATASTGTQVVSATPLWWDSSSAGADTASAGDGEPEALPYTATGSSISLDVTGATQGKAVTYPLYVDPDWTAPLQHTWYDDVAYPNQSYLDVGTDRVGRGVENGIMYVSRAFFQFQTGFLTGKVVSHASLNITQTYSNSCDTTPIQLWEYGVASNPGFTWNQEPNLWHKDIDDQASNWGGCNNPAGKQGFDATQAAKDAAVAHSGIIQLGLRTQNEANELTRKHYNNDPSLVVTYDTPPPIPDTLSLATPDRDCGTAANPVYVNDAAQKITMQARIRDADPGAVSAQFAVHRTSNLDTGIWALSSSPSSTDGMQSVAVPQSALTGTDSFAWRVRANDGIVTTEWSGWCYFTVDNTAPAAPTVAVDSGGSPLLNSDGSAKNPFSAPGTGKPITVDVTSPASDHVAMYEYWWVTGAGTNVATTPVPSVPLGDALPPCSSNSGRYSFTCAASGSTSTLTTKITVAPTDAPSATLWVAAFDKAGNVSVNTVSRSAALTIQTLGADNVDPNNVDYATGHSWSTTADGAASYPAGNVPDQNLTSSLPLALDADPAGILESPVSQAGLPSGYSINSALALPGYVNLGRGYNSTTTDHAAVVEATFPSGYAADTALGGLSSADKSAPADSQMLYTCALPNGDAMTSKSSTCENQGVSGTPLGFGWKSASDVAGTAIPLYRCKVAWASGGTEHFDSTSSSCEGKTVDISLGFIAPLRVDHTATKAIDTTASFTVSAWVYPTQANSSRYYRTIMSQSGSSSSGFYLQQVATSGGGVARFCLRSQSTLALGCVVSTGSLPTSAWSYVTGIWDATNHQLRIVVNDQIDGQSIAGYSYPAGETSAAGAIQVGGGQVAGSLVNQWDGQIANPVVFQGVVDSPQLSNLYYFRDPQ